MRHKQTLLGGAHAPPGQRGNCYQTSLANLLGLSLSDVPHAFDGTLSRDDAWALIDAWLAERGLRRQRIAWAAIASGEAPIDLAEIVIAVGRPPERDFLHAVLVDQVTRDHWRLVHDPAPDVRGFVGAPRYVERIIAR